MKVKGILFDKDGTLIDFHASWMPITRRLTADLAKGNAALTEALMIRGGKAEDEERIVSGSILAAGNTEELADAWLPLLPAWEKAALIAYLDERLTNEGASQAMAVGDLNAIFAALRARGLILGVATSDSEGSARATLQRFAAEHHLAFIAGYDSGYAPKPRPEVGLAFCKHAGLSPEEAIMVGDNQHDIDLARGAGFARAVGVLTGNSITEELAEADAVLPSIVALEAWLLAEGLL